MISLMDLFGGKIGFTLKFQRNGNNKLKNELNPFKTDKHE
jgi:hypothetical protein